jgi:hypothetical protein
MGRIGIGKINACRLLVGKAIRKDRTRKTKRRLVIILRWNLDRYGVVWTGFV